MDRKTLLDGYQHELCKNGDLRQILKIPECIIIGIKCGEIVIFDDCGFVYDAELDEWVRKC